VDLNPAPYPTPDPTPTLKKCVTFLLQHVKEEQTPFQDFFPYCLFKGEKKTLLLKIFAGEKNFLAKTYLKSRTGNLAGMDFLLTPSFSTKLISESDRKPYLPI
jgi:hypothetical protein